MSKEAIKSVLTPKFLVLLVIFSVIHAMWSAYNGMFMNWMPWMQGIGLGSDPGPFAAYLVLLFIWMIVALVPPLRKGLTMQQLTILFAASTVIAVNNGYMKWFDMEAAMQPYWANPAIKSWEPIGTWGVSEAAWDGALLGHVAVPWGDWMGPLVYWTAWTTFILALGIGWASVFRKRFVEIALFPFPYAEVGTQTIKAIAGPKEAAPVNKKLLLGAMAVTLVYYVPVLLRKILPWFPDLYGWENWPFVPWGMGSFDPTAAWPALGGIWYGDLMIVMHPWYYGIYYIVPLNISFSVAFSWLLWSNVLAHIFVVTGLSPAPAVQSHFRGGWISNVWPLNTCATFYGMMYGIIAMEFIVNYKYYIGTLKAIATPTPDEANEPVPYRYAWLMIVGSFLVVSALGMAAGMEVGDALGSTLIIMVMFMGLGIIYAQASSVWSPGFSARAQGFWLLTPGQTKFNRSESLALSLQGTKCDDFGRCTSSLGLPVSNFYMAYRTGTKPRDVFIGMLVAIVVSQLVSYPIMIQTMYGIGHQYIPVRGHFGWGMPDVSWGGNPDFTFGGPTSAGPWAVLGFAISAAVIFLGARIPNFPLNAAGLAVGIQQSVVWWGTGAAALVAHIIKRIVLRVGGTEANEKYGIPIATGVVFGSAIFIFLFGMISIYRGFVPA